MGALPAPDTLARGNHDTSTHQGTAYELMRFYSGDEPALTVPHHRATAEVPTNSESLILSVEVTAHTTHLVRIAWIDDTGELVGTWCPTDMVRTTHGPRNQELTIMDDEKHLARATILAQQMGEELAKAQNAIAGQGYRTDEARREEELRRENTGD